jgi:hypothetical protein
MRLCISVAATILIPICLLKNFEWLELFESFEIYLGVRVAMAWTFSTSSGVKNFFMNEDRSLEFRYVLKVWKFAK